VSAMKKRKPRKNEQPQAVTIDQKKRDRVAAIIAIMIGLLSARQAAGFIVGVTSLPEDTLQWLLWYTLCLGLVSVVAGVGIWKGLSWSGTVSVNILALHAVVFIALLGLRQFGQPVSMAGVFGMLLTTFSWIVIVSLLKWNRQDRTDAA
jgi:fucose 4-O-acetylase-like acetyltransferase